MSDIKEENAARRTIDHKTYVVERVPNGERNTTVTTTIKCALKDWSFEGTLSPKRVELCIASFLVQEKALSQTELQFCGGIGTGMGLNACRGLGFASQSEYEAALKAQANQEDSFVKERITLVIREIIEKGDRAIDYMMLRNKMVSDVRIFPWLNPSAHSAFDSVKEVFAETSDAFIGRDPFE